MDSEARQELEATLAAREELGPAHDEQLVAGFLDRIEKEIDRRVDERVAAPVKQPRVSRHTRDARRLHPDVIIAGDLGHALGIVAAAADLVVVLLVSELRR